MELELSERETIISWDEAGKMANIYTHNPRWIKHLEKTLGLKPVMQNDVGGKEYEIDKHRIPLPRAPRKLTDEARAKLGKRLKDARENRGLVPKAHNTTMAQAPSTTELRGRHAKRIRGLK